MKIQDKLLPAVIPFPADISEEIKNGKQEEKLDVNIQTVAVPEEILSDPDMWMHALGGQAYRRWVLTRRWQAYAQILCTTRLAAMVSGRSTSKKRRLSRWKRSERVSKPAP